MIKHWLRHCLELLRRAFGFRPRWTELELRRGQREADRIWPEELIEAVADSYVEGQPRCEECGCPLEDDDSECPDCASGIWQENKV